MTATLRRKIKALDREVIPQASRDEWKRELEERQRREPCGGGYRIVRKKLPR